MNTNSDAEAMLLVVVAVLLFMGIREVLTGTIRILHRDRRERVVKQTVFADPIVIYAGWAKLLWSIPLVIFGVQGVQQVRPNVLDAVTKLVNIFVKTDVEVILFILLVISGLMLLFPYLMARMYGDTSRRW